MLLLLALLQKTCDVQNIGYGHSLVIKMINIFHWHTCIWEHLHLRVQICCLGKVQNFPVVIAQACSELKTHIHACMTIFGLLFFHQSLLYSDLQFQLNSDKLFLKLCQKKSNFSCIFFRYTPDICYSFFTHYLNQSILMGKIVQNNIWILNKYL